MNYKKVYENLIKQAKLKNRIKLKKTDINYIYYEKHHIKPICLEGDDNRKNLVLLTAKEHFVAHKLLTYIYKGNRKIACAYHKMTYGNTGDHNKSSKDYSYARELISKIGLSNKTKKKISDGVKKTFQENPEIKEKISENSKKLKGKIAHNKGIKMSDEQKQKISIANKGKIISKETKIKMSESAKKKPQISEETRKKLSEARKGKLNPMAGKFGKNNPNYGSKRTEETKEKMRKSKSNTQNMIIAQRKRRNKEKM